MMAIRATVVPRDAKVSTRGRTISLAVSEDLDLNDYALLVDTPCVITIEPMPQQADSEMWEIDGELVE